MIYRVDVVGGSVADVVRRAGGWIFDRSMQGWAVNVVIPRPGDTRPIEILGASVNAPVGPEHSAPQMFLVEAGGEVVEHRLSTAARLFKTQAMIAARLTPIASDHETLFASSPSTACVAEVVELQSVTAVAPS